MWEARRLTTLWGSPVCYMDCFAFYISHIVVLTGMSVSLTIHDRMQTIKMVGTPLFKCLARLSLFNMGFGSAPLPSIFFLLYV
jgi:hypothetical protein